MNPNDLSQLPPPPQGQTGITLDQFQHLPPPPQGQQGFTLDQIKGGQTGDVTQPKQGFLSKVGNAITSVLPGKQLGTALGNSIYGIGQLIKGNKQGFQEAAQENQRIMPQVFGDVGQAVLTAGAPLIGGGATIPGRIAANVALGAGIGGTGAVAQGENLGGVAKSTAIGGAVGGGISALGETGKYLTENMPRWFTKLALPKLGNTMRGTPQETVDYALKNTKGTTLRSMWNNSKSAINSYENQVQAVLNHPQYANEVGNLGSKAEEFVKAQPKLYHSGTADIQAVNTGKSNFSKTFYLSDNADYAKSFGGKNSTLNKMTLDPKAKMADMSKPSPDLIAKIESKVKEKIAKNVPYGDKNFSLHPFSTDTVLQGIKDGKAHFAELPEIKTILKELGYDGQITSEVPYAKNIGVWNKDVVKTKSQLTDFYNQAKTTNNNAIKSVQDAFPNAGLDENKISSILKQVAPENKSLVDKVIKGTANLQEQNTLRKELDLATKKAYGDKPNLTFAKSIGKSMADFLRGNVQSTAPETALIFSEYSKEHALNQALGSALSKKRVAGPLVAGVGGFAHSGLTGAAEAIAIEEGIRSPTAKLLGAKAIQGIGKVALPLGKTVLQGGKAPLIRNLSNRTSNQ